MHICSKQCAANERRWDIFDAANAWHVLPNINVALLAPRIHSYEYYWIFADDMHTYVVRYHSLPRHAHTGSCIMYGIVYALFQQSILSGCIMLANDRQTHEAIASHTFAICCMNWALAPQHIERNQSISLAFDASRYFVYLNSNFLIAIETLNVTWYAERRHKVLPLSHSYFVRLLPACRIAIATQHLYDGAVHGAAAQL